MKEWNKINQILTLYELKKSTEKLVENQIEMSVCAILLSLLQMKKVSNWQTTNQLKFCRRMKNPARDASRKTQREWPDGGGFPSFGGSG